ncbi:MAG TPA: TraR/DksA C4-type zinc finger protein [Acidiferrobacter sp.]|nr:TraR/DksA C4-type zinc finger protein [Acidiferrobacter sp.]
MSEITKQQQDALSKKLQERRDELIKMMRAGTADANHDDMRHIGAEVSRPDDQSLALQVAELNRAEMQSEAQELRAIDHAFERLKDGTYDHCSECGASIPYARLSAYPMAERCVQCQARYEQQSDGHDTAPSS